MRRIEEMGAAVVEHSSPTRGRRRYAEAKEAHGRFGQDGSGHADRGLYDHGLNNVWQNVADDDAKIAGPESAGSFDEFTLAGGENLAADQASIAYPSSERERENQIEDARTAESDERNREQNSRERQECIHQDDVDEAVDGASVVAGDGSDDKAERERGQHDATSNQHRDARAIDDARENVAAEFGGAEEVSVRWWVEPGGEVDGGGILRRDPGRE